VKQPKGGLAGWRCFSFAFVKNSQTALPKILRQLSVITYAMELSQNGCSQRQTVNLLFTIHIAKL
jgi:hypothetical protein